MTLAGPRRLKPEITQTCAIHLEHCTVLVPRFCWKGSFLMLPLYISADFISKYIRCTSSAIVILGLALGMDATGVSQAMNYVFHQPAKR